MDKIIYGVPCDRVKQLCEAEKDGRCVVLPCKVGDTLYWIDNCHYTNEDCKIKKSVVSNIRLTDYGIWIGFYSGENVSEEQFGKNVFFKYEDAEKEWEERKSK